MELTKRTVLDVGPRCNISCKFCYYKDSHEQKNLSTKELKKRLEKAKSYGIQSIEFTGGEPAIREDIFELIGYAKKLNFNRLGIITNGIIFSSFDFTKNIKKIGIDEIKFSIHGSNPKIHDEITSVCGSFKKLIRGLKNAKKVELAVSTCTVINQINYKNLPSIAKFLIILKPLKRLNFELINPIIDAKKLKEDILAPYSKITPYLHKALDILITEKCNLAIRYIPFCFMKGYEKYVCNLCQVQYDPDEWDYLIKNRLEYGFVLSKLNQVAGYANMFKQKYIPKQDFAHTAMIESKLLRLTTKGKVCRKCKYDFICDGLWKNYAKLYGYSELKSSIGKKIEEPYAFMTK